jgi:hypothetical protein
MTHDTIEISVSGTRVKVPVLDVGGKSLAVLGKRLKMAVLHDEEWLETCVDDPELCVKMLKDSRRNGVRADIFTFGQKIPATIPKYNYRMEWDSIAVVNTTSFKNWWDKLPQEGRKNVRRAQKRGVVIEVKQLDDDLVRGIMDITKETPVRQGRAFSHYGKTFEQMKLDHSAFLERSDFICAYFGTELIGFLKLVYRGDIASILQLLPKVSHQDKRPANLMLAKAVELCEARGISHMIYGMFNYGKKRESSLTEFKARNGFEEVLMPRYYVPLSSWGKLCVTLKLYRGLIGLLPKGVIEVGLRLRSVWYNRVRPSAGVA